jgi:hypothetical protein
LRAYQTWQYIFNKEIPKKQFYITSNIRTSSRPDKQFYTYQGLPDKIKNDVPGIDKSAKADSLLVIERI